MPSKLTCVPTGPMVHSRCLDSGRHFLLYLPFCYCLDIGNYIDLKSPSLLALSLNFSYPHQVCSTQVCITPLVSAVPQKLFSQLTIIHGKPLYLTLHKSMCIMIHTLFIIVHVYAVGLYSPRKVLRTYRQIKWHVTKSSDSGIEENMNNQLQYKLNMVYVCISNTKVYNIYSD